MSVWRQVLKKVEFCESSARRRATESGVEAEEEPAGFRRENDGRGGVDVIVLSRIVE